MFSSLNTTKKRRYRIDVSVAENSIGLCVRHVGGGLGPGLQSALRRIRPLPRSICRDARSSIEQGYVDRRYPHPPRARIPVHSLNRDNLRFRFDALANRARIYTVIKFCPRFSSKRNAIVNEMIIHGSRDREIERKELRRRRKKERSPIRIIVSTTFYRASRGREHFYRGKRVFNAATSRRGLRRAL